MSNLKERMSDHGFRVVRPAKPTARQLREIAERERLLADNVERVLSDETGPGVPASG